MSGAVARATLTSYLRLLVTALVQFAMVPIVLGYLGAEEYGRYSLILSVLGFFALLELGAGAGAMKAAAAGAATGALGDRDRALSAQLAIGLAAAAIAVVLVAGLAAGFGPAFKVPPHERPAVATALFLLGLRSAVLAWPFGVLRSALYGHGETSLVNGLQSAGAVVYAALGWAALHLGYGLVGFAAANLGAFLLEHLAYGYFAFRRLPGLRLRPDWRDRAGIRTGLSLGGSQLLVAVAGMILLRTDPIIIQAFLPLSAVGAYAVALRVADQSFLLTKQFVNALSPLVAALHADGREDRVRHVALTGTRYALALALVPAIPLAINADHLLIRWVGPEFTRAGPALAILVTAMALMAPQMVASSVLTYTDRHHATARLALQAVAVNVIASLLLVRPLGLTGVALGTLIAVLVVDVGLAGTQLCRALGLRRGEYWREALVPVLIPALAAVSAGLMLRWAAPATGYGALALQGAATAAVLMAAAAVWTIRPTERAAILKRFRAASPTPAFQME